MVQALWRTKSRSERYLKGTDFQSAFHGRKRTAHPQSLCRSASRVEYTLTETGYSLKTVLDAMAMWGTEYKQRPNKQRIQIRSSLRLSGFFSYLLLLISFPDFSAHMPSLQCHPVHIPLTAVPGCGSAGSFHASAKEYNRSIYT